MTITARVTAVNDLGNGTTDIVLQSLNNGVPAQVRSVNVASTRTADWAIFKISQFLANLNAITQSDNAPLKSLIGTVIGSGIWTVTITSITNNNDGTLTVVLQTKRNAINGPSRSVNIPDTATADWLKARAQRWVDKWNFAEADEDDANLQDIISLEIGPCLVRFI